MRPTTLRITPAVWLSWLFSLCLLASPTWLLAQDEASTARADADTLVAQQQWLDRLKQRAAQESDDGQLSVLKDESRDLARQAGELGERLGNAQVPLQSQLSVLGSRPDEDVALHETHEVTRQRQALERQLAQLQEQLQQAQAIQSGADNLSIQIIALRRDRLKSQLAINSGSILAPAFWHPLSAPAIEDRQRLQAFASDLLDSSLQSLRPGALPATLALLLAAALLALYGNRLLGRGLGWFCINHLPVGRLRRSTLASGNVLATLLVAFGSAWLLYQGLLRHAEARSTVAQLGDELLRLTLFCALIAALGRAFLSNERPSWRLPSMADDVALALKPFPLLLAWNVFLCGSLEQMFQILGISVSYSLLANGLSALLIAVTVLFIALRANRIRRQLTQAGQEPEARSTIAGLLHLFSSATSIGVLLALLGGYIPLARFLAYELVWAGIVLASLYLLASLLIDLIETLCSSETPIGQRVQQTLNAEPRHMALAASLLTAFTRASLALLAVVALLNGAFGSTTPLSLLQRFFELLGGDGWERLNIVPAHILNAILCLVVGLYLLRTAKRWLSEDFLPKTQLDVGIRSSMVTLVANIGYVVVILITLSAMGIQWSNLAWIVSALSVGIGFGLQEIVKNFISGLILLTERPVKVGDLVSISGVEGDIRRINVRATEIQLSDRSTVIVPNSQLISQNVRNATMGNAQGVVTIALTLPLDIDPEQVRDLLLNTFKAHERILDTPAPSVTFSQLTPTGIVLSTTGYVSSPRLVSSTKSALLFEVLKVLRANAIDLSSPQKMLVENVSSPAQQDGSTQD